MGPNRSMKIKHSMVLLRDRHHNTEEMMDITDNKVELHTRRLHTNHKRGQLE
jgi:hypothetical protein